MHMWPSDVGHGNCNEFRPFLYITSYPRPQQLIDFIPVKMGWLEGRRSKTAKKNVRSFLLGAAHITTVMSVSKTCASGRIVSSVLKKGWNTYTRIESRSTFYSAGGTHSRVYCNIWIASCFFLSQIYIYGKTVRIDPLCSLCIDPLFLFSLRTTYTQTKRFPFSCFLFFLLLLGGFSFFFSFIRNNKKKQKYIILLFRGQNGR